MKKFGIKTFALPAQDKAATNFMNTPGVTIVAKQICPMPKESFILLYLEYEDIRDEDEITDCFNEMEDEEDEGEFDL